MCVSSFVLPYSVRHKLSWRYIVFRCVALLLFINESYHMLWFALYCSLCFICGNGAVAFHGLLCFISGRGKLSHVTVCFVLLWFVLVCSCEENAATCYDLLRFALHCSASLCNALLIRGMTKN